MKLVLLISSLSFFLVQPTPGRAAATESTPSDISMSQSWSTTEIVTTRRDSKLHIQWKASVNEEGGRFLLYRGNSSDSMQVFAERTPQPRTVYEVVDLPVFSGSTVYELRYRDRFGREHLLTSEAVSVSVISAVPPPGARNADEVFQAATELKLVASALSDGTQSNHLQEYGGFAQFEPEPSTPPPEQV